MARLTNKEIQEQVTATVIEALETGHNPFQARFTRSSNPMPHNCISAHEYRGINVVYLWAVAMLNSWPDQWLSFKQAKTNGGQVRKGEKCTRVIFCQPITRDNENEETATFWYSKTIPVFNIAQCDEVELPESETIATTSTSDSDAAITNALELYRQHNAILETIADGSPYYSPSEDKIRLLSANRFKSPEGYAATALHELTHWTGHETRCKRDLSGGFGSVAYAFEELVAELGSAMLCAKRGINGKTEHHASYIENWLKVLKGDNKAIFRASKLAEEALIFLVPDALPKLKAA